MCPHASTCRTRLVHGDMRGGCTKRNSELCIVADRLNVAYRQAHVLRAVRKT